MVAELQGLPLAPARQYWSQVMVPNSGFPFAKFFTTRLNDGEFGGTGHQQEGHFQRFWDRFVLFFKCTACWNRTHPFSTAPPTRRSRTQRCSDSQADKCGEAQCYTPLLDVNTLHICRNLKLGVYHSISLCVLTRFISNIFLPQGDVLGFTLICFFFFSLFFACFLRAWAKTEYRLAAVILELSLISPSSVGFTLTDTETQAKLIFSLQWSRLFTIQLQPFYSYI